MKPIQQMTLWLLVLTAAFSACEKADMPAKEEKLASIRMGNFFRLFRYNERGQLTQIVDSSGATQATSRISMEYGNGRLSRMIYGRMTYTYSYPNNNTVEVLLRNASNEPVTREVFHYVNNRLSEYTRFDATAGNPDIRSVFTYDPAGNVANMVDWTYDNYQSKAWSRAGSRVSTYDNKVNLSSGLEAYHLPFVDRNLHLNANNPLKDEWYDAGNRLINTKRHHYEYDSKGRKTKRISETVVHDRVTNTETSWFTYW